MSAIRGIRHGLSSRTGTKDKVAGVLRTFFEIPIVVLLEMLTSLIGPSLSSWLTF